MQKKISKFHERAKKLVKVCFCLHSILAKQCKPHFNLTNLFDKIPISRRFEIFTKASHLKLVGTPCIKFFRTKIGTKLWKTKKKSLEIRTWLHIPKLGFSTLFFSRGLKFSLHFCNRVLTCFLSFLAELSSPLRVSFERHCGKVT